MRRSQAEHPGTFPSGITLGESTVLAPETDVRLGVDAFYLQKAPDLQLAVYRLLNGIFNLAPVVREEALPRRTLSLPVPPEALPRQSREEMQAEISVYMVVSNDWDHGIENETMINGVVYPFGGTPPSHAYILFDFDQFSAHSATELSIIPYLRRPTLPLALMPGLDSPHAANKFNQVLERFEGDGGKAFFTDTFAHAFRTKSEAMPPYYETFMTKKAPVFSVA